MALFLKTIDTIKMHILHAFNRTYCMWSVATDSVRAYQIEQTEYTNSRLGACSPMAYPDKGYITHYNARKIILYSLLSSWHFLLLWPCLIFSTRLSGPRQELIMQGLRGFFNRIQGVPKLSYLLYGLFDTMQEPDKKENKTVQFIFVPGLRSI